MFASYYSIMQKEFIISFLRFCINKKYNYKKKYIDICEYKKKEILKLAFRNNNATIFDDIIRWDKYVDEIIENGFGLPHFIYKDAKQKENLYKWDAFYYFHKESTVVIGNQEAIVVKNDSYAKKLTVLIDGQRKQFAYDEVKGSALSYLKMNKKQLQLMKSNVLASLFLNQS